MNQRLIDSDDYRPILSEAQVKSACEDYLEIMKAQGKLIYFRLNAGDFIETRGGSRRRIKGAGQGTADLVVIQGGEVQMVHILQPEKAHASHPVCFVTFVECKATKGQVRPVQMEFKETVEKLNCRYFIVRSLDELMEVLKTE